MPLKDALSKEMLSMNQVITAPKNPPINVKVRTAIRMPHSFLKYPRLAKYAEKTAISTLRTPKNKDEGFEKPCSKFVAKPTTTPGK